MQTLDTDTECKHTHNKQTPEGEIMALAELITRRKGENLAYGWQLIIHTLWKSLCRQSRSFRLCVTGVMPKTEA